MALLIRILEMGYSKKDEVIMVYIVGLAGPGKVGKSTTAKRLVNAFRERHDQLRVTNYAFAQPLYEVASLLTELPVDTLRNESYKETPWTDKTAPIPGLIDWTPRKFLQVVGTECFRNQVCSSFWVQMTLKKISSFDIAFIEDARFPNEYELCNIVIELEREGVVYAKNHPSAMPPEEKYVWKKIRLTKDMSYNELADQIFSNIKKEPQHAHAIQHI